MPHATRQMSRMRDHARVLSLSLAVIALSTRALAADEVAVPDIETRIQNSGGSIPPQAVPRLENPAPLPIPESARKERGGVAEPPLPVADGGTTPPAEGLPLSANGKPGLHGSASLGAGSPSLLSGSLSLYRARDERAGFSFGFSHDSSDGYGKKEPGSGFFDRETSASATVGGTFLSGDANLSIGIKERSDGFQGKNAAYYALTKRSLDWDYSMERKGSTNSGVGLTLRLGSTGWIDKAFAEGPSSGSPPAGAIEDYAGFGLRPVLSIGLSRGDFSSRLEGTFSYDSLANRDPGESKSGMVALVGTYSTQALDVGTLTAEARVGALVESREDALVPFDCSLSFESERAPIRSLSLSGGLSADRQDPFALSAIEPFALVSGVPYHSADWNATGKATVAVLGSLLIDVGAEWRSTAFGRGVLALSGETDPSTALVPIGSRARDSLATRALAKWGSPGIVCSGGISDEWMDRLNRKTLHALEGSITLFDRAGAPRDGASGSTARDATLARWETTGRARIPLDSGEYPCLGVSGTVRPIPSFAVSLEVADILPLAAGRLRERNGLYAERSGAVILSGRVDL